MGGSRNGSGVRRYSGRGGRLEESSMTVVAMRSVLERSVAVLLIRNAAVVGPLRPDFTNSPVESCVKR